MKHSILVLVLALGLAACSNSSKGGDADKGDNGGQESMKNVTDYSACERVGNNRIEGNWQQHMRSENLESILTVQINRNSTRFTADCKSNGRALRATVLIQTSYTQDTYSMLQADTDKKEINENDFNMACEVSTQVAKFAYRFKGACLVVEMNGQEETLVPARF